MSVHALIVDDNQSNVRVLASLLARNAVTTAYVLHPKDLPKALEAEERIDLAFIDLEMPGQNGFEVLNVLRDDPRCGLTRFIAYTVHVSEMPEAHERGFHSFLGKPLNAERFAVQIEQILRGEEVWDRF